MVKLKILFVFAAVAIAYEEHCDAFSTERPKGQDASSLRLRDISTRGALSPKPFGPFEWNQIVGIAVRDGQQERSGQAEGEDQEDVQLERRTRCVSNETLPPNREHRPDSTKSCDARRDGIPKCDYIFSLRASEPIVSCFPRSLKPHERIFPGRRDLRAMFRESGGNNLRNTL